MFSWFFVQEEEKEMKVSDATKRNRHLLMKEIKHLSKLKKVISEDEVSLKCILKPLSKGHIKDMKFVMKTLPSPKKPTKKRKRKKRKKKRKR